MSKKKPDSRETIIEDVKWFERVLALAIHYKGAFTFDPDDFKHVAGMSVVIIPHEHDPTLLGAILMKTEEARKVAGKPARKGMH